MKQHDNTVGKRYAVDEAQKTVNAILQMAATLGLDDFNRQVFAAAVAKMSLAVRQTARIVAPEDREPEVSRALVACVLAMLGDAYQFAGPK